MITFIEYLSLLIKILSEDYKKDLINALKSYICVVHFWYDGYNYNTNIILYKKILL